VEAVPPWHGPRCRWCPSPSRWAGPTLVITPTSGSQIRPSRVISPAWFIPSSSTAAVCAGVSRSSVRGRPIWLFRFPLVLRVENFLVDHRIHEHAGGRFAVGSGDRQHLEAAPVAVESGPSAPRARTVSATATQAIPSSAIIRSTGIWATWPSATTTPLTPRSRHMVRQNDGRHEIRRRWPQTDAVRIESLRESMPMPANSMSADPEIRDPPVAANTWVIGPAEWGSWSQPPAAFMACQHLAGHFPVVEMNGFAGQNLIGFVPFAGNQHSVACTGCLERMRQWLFAGPAQPNNRSSCHSTVNASAARRRVHNLSDPFLHLE
jgi:hypothetical protein